MKQNARFQECNRQIKISGYKMKKQKAKKPLDYKL